MALVRQPLFDFSKVPEEAVKIFDIQMQDLSRPITTMNFGDAPKFAPSGIEYGFFGGINFAKFFAIGGAISRNGDFQPTLSVNCDPVCIRIGMPATVLNVSIKCGPVAASLTWMQNEVHRHNVFQNGFMSTIAHNSVSDISLNRELATSISLPPVHVGLFANIPLARFGTETSNQEYQWVGSRESPGGGVQEFATLKSVQTKHEYADVFKIFDWSHKRTSFAQSDMVKETAPNGDVFLQSEYTSGSSSSINGSFLGVLHVACENHESKEHIVEIRRVQDSREVRILEKYVMTQIEACSFHVGIDLHLLGHLSSYDDRFGDWSSAAMGLQDLLYSSPLPFFGFDNQVASRRTVDRNAHVTYSETCSWWQCQSWRCTTITENIVHERREMTCVKILFWGGCGSSTSTWSESLPTQKHCVIEAKYPTALYTCIRTGCLSCLSEVLTPIVAHVLGAQRPNVRQTLIEAAVTFASTIIRVSAIARVNGPLLGSVLGSVISGSLFTIWSALNGHQTAWLDQFLLLVIQCTLSAVTLSFPWVPLALPIMPFVQLDRRERAAKCIVFLVIILLSSLLQ